MPRSVFREEVCELMDQGAQVLEVLPRDDYEWKHLPGAASVPLKELTSEAVGHLDRDQPIVVYCNDFQ